MTTDDRHHDDEASGLPASESILADVEAGFRVAGAARDAAPATGSGPIADALDRFADGIEQQMLLNKGERDEGVGWPD